MPYARHIQHARQTLPPPTARTPVLPLAMGPGQFDVWAGLYRSEVVMQRRRNSSHTDGFTLIELMMVIVILSLLAALMAALFGNSSKEAKRNATQSAAMQTQQAIEMYRQYTNELPDLLTSWDPLTQQTTLPDGRRIGPFMDHPPINQVVDTNGSAIVDGDEPVLYTEVAPFQYDYQAGAGTGRFIAALEPTPAGAP
jgi:prepilin-type N-terminal cleavage/methylation domain-containing protein